MSQNEPGVSLQQLGKPMSNKPAAPRHHVHITNEHQLENSAAKIILWTRDKLHSFTGETIPGVVKILSRSSLFSAKHTNLSYTQWVTEPLTEFKLLYFTPLYGIYQLPGEEANWRDAVEWLARGCKIEGRPPEFFDQATKYLREVYPTLVTRIEEYEQYQAGYQAEMSLLINEYTGTGEVQSPRAVVETNPVGKGLSAIRETMGGDFTLRMHGKIALVSLPENRFHIYQLTDEGFQRLDPQKMNSVELEAWIMERIKETWSKADVARMIERRYTDTLNLCRKLKL